MYPFNAWWRQCIVTKYTKWSVCQKYLKYWPPNSICLCDFWCYLWNGCYNHMVYKPQFKQSWGRFHDWPSDILTFSPHTFVQNLVKPFIIFWSDKTFLFCASAKPAQLIREYLRQGKGLKSTSWLLTIISFLSRIYPYIHPAFECIAVMVSYPSVCPIRFGKCA